MDPLRVDLGPRSYEIRFGDLGGLVAFAEGTTTALLVCDEKVKQLAELAASSLKNAGIRSEIAVVPSGEASKSLRELERLYDTLAKLPADRRTLIVAVGGGVVGDLAGFAAASFNRGLPLLMVPTTLLSMVDSSVGGKTGINHPLGKNLIGAFHQPRGVWIDLGALTSLPEREYRSGLAEVVKYGVILDAAFFEWLETNATSILARESATLETMIARCCRLKADVVEKDEREETGLRAVLNYGHTFGHAFETLGNYTHWLHGEAVSAGMTMAAILARKLNRIDDPFVYRQTRLLTQFQLPTTIPDSWPVEELLAAMRRDKKSLAGKLRFVLPSRLGHVELVEDVPEDLVREVLR